MNTENTINFNINLNKPVISNGQTETTNPTQKQQTNTGLATPNTGFFNSATTDIIASSAVLTVTIIGAFFIYKFFHKKKRKKYLPIAASVSMLLILAIASSFSLTKAINKVINLDANILNTDEIAYIKDTITIPEATAQGFTLSVYYGDTNPDGKLSLKDDSTNYLSPTTGTKDVPALLTDKTYGITFKDPANNAPVWLAPANNADTPIYKTDIANAANHKLDIYYGVKAKNLKAGIYQGTIKYKITPNQRTFHNITTMQQMTAQICQDETKPTKEATNTTTEHTTDTNLVPEATLTDTRDGKTYVVRKLADGNCWMSQNLALSPNGSTAYTEADTDLHDGRTFQAPAASSIGTTWNQNGLDGAHWLSPQAGYEYFQNGTTTSSTGQPTESTGNYYDWPMATAMSGQSLTNDGDEAPDSICPKGWRLPPNEGNKSYQNLLINSYNTPTNSDAALLAMPLSFIRAGNYNPGVGSFGVLGSGGLLWSSTVYGSYNTYVLGISSSNVYPQYNGSRGYGTSVRCVVR